MGLWGSQEGSAAVGGTQSPLGAEVGNSPRIALRKRSTSEGDIADIGADTLSQAKPGTVTQYEFRERLVRIPITNQGSCSTHSAQ